MQGIQQITQEVNKKSKLNNQETTKKVLNAFLEVTKQKLIEGESLSFKGFFTIKRSTTQPKGSKHCSKHDKNFEWFQEVNQGKGLAAYTKSAKFRSLVQEARKCKDCQNKKQQLAKNVKLTNRISFKPSKDFWKVSKKR